MKAIKDLNLKNKDMVQEAFITLSICFLLFAYYSVLLFSSYTGDDIYNSCIRGNCNEMNIGIWQYIFTQAKGWLQGGRVYPMAMLVYLIFYIFNSIFKYKGFLLAITLIDIYIEGCILKKITKSLFWKNLGMLVLGLLFPVYMYGGVNCLSTFGGLVQMVLFWGLLAIVEELKYYENGEKKELWLSAFFAMCSMLTYEIGYIFPCILFIMALFKSKKMSETFRSQIPNFLLCGGLGIFTLIWMMSHKARYPGVELKLNLQNIWETFKIQFTGALPMINWNKADRPWYITERWISESYENMQFTTVFIVIFAIILTGYCLVKIEYVKIPISQRMALMSVGIVMWVIPSLLIALSAKYQEELMNSNLPYLPYMLEMAGVGLFLIGLFGGRYGKIIFGILLTAAIIIFIPVYRYGAILENETNRPIYGRPREILIEATENGMFSDVEENALIVLDNRYVTLSCQVFSMIQPDLKTDYLLYLEQRILNKAQVENADTIDCAKDNLYLVKPYISDGVEMVVKGKIDSIIVDPEKETIKEIYCKDIVLYSKWLYFGAPTEVSMMWYDVENDEWIREEMDLMKNVVEEKPEGIIPGYGYKLSFQNALYDYNKFIF